MENQDHNKKLSFHQFSDDKSSPLKKYQNLIIGNAKLSDLIYYELFTFLFMNMPGLPGLFLRQRAYKRLFKKFGKGSTIGVGVSLKQPIKVTIGKNCVIDDFVHISARGDDYSSINISDKVFIGRSTEIKLRNGQINIASNSSIGSSCRIATTNGVVNIGEYVFLAAYCYVGGGNHKSDRTDIPIANQGFESKGGVDIGDDVWIGANCVIADGVKIGKGSIIGACSLVNKDIPEYSIAFGSPSKVVRTRK